MEFEEGVTTWCCYIFKDVWAKTLRTFRISHLLGKVGRQLNYINLMNLIRTFLKGGVFDVKTASSNLYYPELASLLRSPISRCPLAFLSSHVILSFFAGTPQHWIHHAVSLFLCSQPTGCLYFLPRFQMQIEILACCYPDISYTYIY